MLTVLLPITAMAGSKIIMDEMIGNYHVISTNSQLVRQGLSTEFPLNISLSVAMNETDTIWSIAFTIHGQGASKSVPKGGALLIRDGQGEVYESTTTSEYDDKIGHIDNTGTFVYTVYTIHPSYVFDFSDLMQLSRDGIQKIRLQTTDGYLETELKEKNRLKAAKIIGEHIATLRKGISSSRNSKNIADGF